MNLYDLPAPSTSRLTELNQQVERDLALIQYPESRWVPLTSAPDGSQALDVLIVGAGQGGQAVGAALQRERIENFLIIDRAPMGQEGPWRGYARMQMLRSWKTVNGPDLDLPSLTFQS